MVEPTAETQQPPDTLEDQLRLSLVSGVGPLIRRSLVEHFGSTANVLGAAPSQLREVPGVGHKVARAISNADQIDVQRELELCQEHDIAIITSEHEDYPRLLREIPDPPNILFAQGSFLPSDMLSIAIVGTRHATGYGLRQAERLSSSLARAGLTIISGLARGIDKASHCAALDAGGRTIAVLGGGLLRMFPAEHTKLAELICGNGAIFSENPPCFQPSSSSFPRRNRLITGMSLGVIVVEASDRSGALISARHATEQGREVFAVPGAVDSRMSRGCHQLLRDGAKLVESADDVLEELGPLVEATPISDDRMLHHPAELQLNDQEQKVLSCIEKEPTGMDKIIQDSGLPTHRVLSTISVLEMRRLVRRVSGSTVMRN